MSFLDFADYPDTAPSPYISFDEEPKATRRVHKLETIPDDGNKHPCYLCGYLAHYQYRAWDQTGDVQVSIYRMLLCNACCDQHKITGDAESS